MEQLEQFLQYQLEKAGLNLADVLTEPCWMFNPVFILVFEEWS